MFLPPRCSCGFPIGQYGLAFKAVLARRLAAAAEAAGVPLERAALAEIRAPMDDVLDSLRVTRICCRTHMMSALHLTDFTSIG